MNKELSTMNLSELKKEPMEKLMELASKYNVENPSSLRKQELIFSILQACSSQNGQIYGEDGAAELLGIPPTTLASRLKKMGLRES